MPKSLSKSKEQAFSDEQIDLIKRTVAKDATDDELELFLYQAQRTGLDPLSRQIYFIKRGDKGTIQTSIDGFRAIAGRTGEHAGTDDAIFKEENGKIISAAVTVYRLVQGQKCAYAATARWAEYSQSFSPMWKKMPYTMLAKCAESLALRKAFPSDLSGLYTTEEMSQTDDKEDVIETKTDGGTASVTNATVGDELKKQIVALTKELGFEAANKEQYSAVIKSITGYELVENNFLQIVTKLQEIKQNYGDKNNLQERSTDQTV